MKKTITLMGKFLAMTALLFGAAPQVCAQDAEVEEPHYTVNFTPANGSTLSILSSAELRPTEGLGYPEFSDSTMMADRKMELPLLRDGEQVGIARFTVAKIKAGYEILFIGEAGDTLTITEKGTYTVDIPANAIYEAHTYPPIYNEAITLTYYITGTYAPVAYDLNIIATTPTEGQQLNAIDYVTLTSDVNLYRLSGSPIKGGVYDDKGADAGGTLYAYFVVQSTDSTTATLCFTSMGSYPEPVLFKKRGTFTIVIEEGVVGDEDFRTSQGRAGHANPRIEIPVTIIAAASTTIKATASPESDSELDCSDFYFEVALTPDEPCAWLSEGAPCGTLFDLETGETIGDAVVMAGRTDVENNILYVNVVDWNGDPYRKAGDYLLVIEEGMFGNDTYIENKGLTGRTHKKITLNYFVTDVLAVPEVKAAEEGGITVYNLNGVLVLKSNDAADLNKRERGFYIVNGKKMIITK